MTDLSSFQCRQCGNCCRPEGYVILAEGEPERIAAFLGMSTDEFMERYTRLTEDRQRLSLVEKPDHACIFLDDESGCEINDVKPRQCRDFPYRWNFEGFEKICAGMQLEAD
jgi:Fe-S-cluster containining protein